jgi:hypothetical protein
VRKLFATFPYGWPGIGLLILRSAIALDILANAIWASGEPNGVAFRQGVIALLAIVTGLALLTGFLTPVAGTLSSISNVILGADPLIHSCVVSRGTATTAFEMSAISIALVLLGPGGYSLDARLFGRREIIIPAERRQPG